MAANWSTHYCRLGGLEINPSGTIVCYNVGCSSEDNRWCGHIESAMKNSSDSAFFWERDPEMETPDEWNIEIPVLPTLGHFTTVTCVKDRLFGQPKWEISWQNPRFKSPSTSPWLYICHLSPGEGRNAIRLMLFQKMLETVSSIECTAAHHSFPAQKSLELNLKGTLWISEFWTFFTTGMCVYCNSKNNFNDPDLIPSHEGSPFKP